MITESLKYIFKSIFSSGPGSSKNKGARVRIPPACFPHYNRRQAVTLSPFGLRLIQIAAFSPLSDTNSKPVVTWEKIKMGEHWCAITVSQAHFNSELAPVPVG